MTEVTDADRQAAVELATIMMGNCHSFTAELKTAERHFMLTAFARHREAAEAPLRVEVERLREAVAASNAAIAEYYRYWTGGETRGSYDGKPERDGLWRAMYKTRAALEPKP